MPAHSRQAAVLTKLRLAPVVAAAAVSGVACAVTLAWAFATLASRPLDGTEGHLLFDASRIRDHLALYVDPLQGAWEYGPVPARYYVLHTPLWAWVLSRFPAAVAPQAARVLGLACWFGLLAGIAGGAPRPNRWAAWCGALFVGGAYPLTLYGAAGRHDAPALVLSTVALLRTMRRGNAGALEGALFASATLVKPNVLGTAGGVLLHEILARRWRAGPALLGAAAVGGAGALGLHFVSGGTWVEHLLRSTQTMPLSGLWLDQVRSRMPFFGLPLAAAGWWAWRARATPSARVGGCALAVSCVWTLVSLSKVGSASNYWMEPCLIGLAIVSRVPPPAPRFALSSAAAVAALAQSLWVGVAAVRSSLEGIASAPRRRAAILEARRACGAGDDAVVIADEVGLEMMLDHRLVQVPFVMTQLIRTGQYPLDLWQADVARPEVRCLAMQSDLLERPLAEVDVAQDLFAPPMRRTLRARFALVSAHDGVWLYRARY
jgi:hypothetical protein